MVYWISFVLRIRCLKITSRFLWVEIRIHLWRSNRLIGDQKRSHNSFGWIKINPAGDEPKRSHWLSSDIYMRCPNATFKRMAEVLTSDVLNVTQIWVHLTRFGFCFYRKFRRFTRTCWVDMKQSSRIRRAGSTRHSKRTKTKTWAAPAWWFRKPEVTVIPVAG